MSFRKLLSIVLVGVYGTTQVALGALAEANLWAERRRQSIPNAFTTSLPSVAAALPLTSKWTDSNQMQSRGFSTEFRNLLNALPLAQSTIQDVYYSGQDKTSPVVLIHDPNVHASKRTNHFDPDSHDDAFVKEMKSHAMHLLRLGVVPENLLRDLIRDAASIAAENPAALLRADEIEFILKANGWATSERELTLSKS